MPPAPTNPPDSLFSSQRERRLWLWTLVVVVAIFSTLGLARTLADGLRDRGLISDAFWLGLALLAAAVAAVGLKARPRGREIGVALGVAGAYLIAFLRMTVPEERSHLIEYSIVALFVHEALTERRARGRRVPAPAILAILATSLVGLLDESVQALLPSRAFDPRDLLFNLLAALLAVTANAALHRVRRQKK